MATPVAIGVDNGGTWIRMKGLDARGRCVWSLKKPSPTVEKLPAFLRSHLKMFNLSHLAVGSRGVWKPFKCLALKQKLRGLAKRIVVMSDVEAAWLAAFKAQGIIVIAGTGSIAYGKTRSGKIARAGGLGPDTGDEGSGYWIGHEWLRRNGRKEARGPVRKVAALTPTIIKKARLGNRIAEVIVRDAQDHLAGLVLALTRKLSWRGKVLLSTTGSVLENKEFRSGFFKSLRGIGIRFQFIQKHTDPAMAIISHAFR